LRNDGTEGVADQEADRIPFYNWLNDISMTQEERWIFMVHGSWLILVQD
jgi:hypothetical protein